MIVDSLLINHAIARRHRLTPRQAEVLAHLAAGNTAPQIGRQLYIARDTVHEHLKQAAKRLGITSGDGYRNDARSVAAVAMAYELGVFRTRREREALRATRARGAA